MRELMIAAAAGHRGWSGGVGPGRRRSESGGPAGGLLPKGGRVDGGQRAGPPGGGMAYL